MTVGTLDLLLDFVGPASPRETATRPRRRHASAPAVGYARIGASAAAGRALRTEPSGSDGVAEFEGGQDRERIRADQSLMAAIADGDDTAFALVVGEASPRLLRFARSMLAASPAEAEEIVQEALLRLWQQAESWQPQGRISTWLHQVTYRLCIDSLRRRRPSVTIDAVEAELEDEAPAAEERLVRIDEARTVRDAVESLPERQRIAVVLCHFENLSQMDAAAIMGIGESAYESLLARARRKLRVILAGEVEDGDGGDE